MTGVPVLQDEVNRKAFDALSYLTTAVHHGKITPEQFSTGIDVLFMAVSGLVTDPDFIHIISEAQYIIDKEKQNGSSRLHSARESAAHTPPGTW
jgi:hypothetical protein